MKRAALWGRPITVPSSAGWCHTLTAVSSTIVWLPRKVAVPAAGTDGVGAAYSHPPALPALLVRLMVELPGPTAAVSRAGWLESFSEQGWCWWPARAGCWLTLPLPALLESWWLPWLPAVGCA